MKINPSARWIVRIRVTLLCLSLAAIVVADFGLSHSLAAKIGQITASQPGAIEAPNFTVSDLMVAAR
jgi:hypothetical protein